MLTVVTGDHDRLVDDPFLFVIEGCAPGERVAVTAIVDHGGTILRSEAAFEADASGRVDPRVQPSFRGTYEGVDAFGVLWSGAPTGKSDHGAFDPVLISLRVEGTASADEAALRRRWLATGATATAVDEAGVRGLYARPAGPGPFPAVVAFGGSGGGLGPSAAWAPVLASHGFATLSIAYFAASGLPDFLVEVDIECVERAVQWLANRPEVRAAPVAVMGQSRGSELALLAATFLDGIGAVVMFSGSGVVWSGLTAAGPIDKSAWRFREEPISYIPPRGGPSPFSDGGPTALTEVFLAALTDGSTTQRATIPLEHIAGPILAVSGEDDAMWPSATLTAIAEQRASERGFRYPFIHLRYPDAGHTAPGIPGTPIFTEVHHPVDGKHYSFGGTRPGIAAARADSWPQVVRFLTEFSRSTSV